MFITTFYSFKGGVGRTMSLVNVAVRLALAGKKILIVDFDLEAPGISTFSLTAPQKETPGIVEYISDYRLHKVAQNIENYVYTAKKFDNGGELAVMPAGLHDGSYSHRLNMIDWNKLYAEEDGYLFFEDLKLQWRECLKPDYVFIDSRTGHSDVEGICTRQLPDSVCLLFFPNEQNLQGLKRVVANVKSQNLTRRGVKEPISLHFVVSNVPDLDDEDGIVGSRLQRFQRELGYKKLSGEIHHYNSLSLLHQEIFSSTRPNSRLAKEYAVLTAEITQDNIFDRDVATKFLKKVVRDLRSPNSNVIEESSFHIKVERILHHFQNDPEIVLDIALIYEAIGRTSDALAILPAAINKESAHRLAVRARLNHRSGNTAEAIDDLNRMLDNEGAQVPSFLEALSFASQLDLTIFDRLAKSTAIRTLTDNDKAFIGHELQGSRAEINAKYEILESILSTSSELVAHEFAITAIGLGRFERAVEVLKLSNSEPNPPSIDVTFNLAMALWGLNGIPDKNLFARVVELHDESSTSEANGVNYLACLAIANFVIGNQVMALTLLNQSTDLLRLKPKRTFSPWSFTKVSSREFLNDIYQIKNDISNGEIKPAFLTANCNQII